MYPTHRPWRYVVVACVLIITTLSAQLSFASNLTFSPSDTKTTGMLSGATATKKVGPVKPGAGAAVFNDNAIDVLFSNTDFTQKEIAPQDRALRGVAFKLSQSPLGKSVKIKGLCFFNGGSKLKDLSVTGSRDTILLGDGTRITGSITSISRDEVIVSTSDMGTRTISLGQISEISSPRVFSFEVGIVGSSDGSGRISGESQELKFASTYQELKEQSSATTSSPSANEPWSRGRKIAAVIIIGVVIATAIAVPIAVSLGTRRGGNDNAQKTANALALQRLLTPARAPAPPPPPPPAAEP